jgi:hypothetical protein
VKLFKNLYMYFNLSLWFNNFVPPLLYLCIIAGILIELLAVLFITFIISNKCLGIEALNTNMAIDVLAQFALARFYFLLEILGLVLFVNGSIILFLFKRFKLNAFFCILTILLSSILSTHFSLPKLDNGYYPDCFFTIN